MREGALAGGLCLFHGEFLFFCDVVLSSDMNLQDTRKSPMGMEVPRGKRKARMCARIHPSSNDSATPRPSGGPQLTLSLCPSGPVLHPKGPLVSRSHRPDR